MTTERKRLTIESRWVWGGLLLLTVGAVYLVVQEYTLLKGWADALFVWLGQADSLTRTVRSLGWAAPLGLIAINALQIVIAPLPNYAIFVVAGLLFGPVWGGIYGLAGMLLGGVTAMLLTRRFGRPLAVRMVGAERLDRWDSMQATQSVISWTILFLAPVGDIPYFLAGLSHIGVAKVVAISAITRGPTIFLIATASSGATGMTWTQLVLVIVALVVIFGLLARYQQQVLAWVDRRLPRRMESILHPGSPDSENL